MNDTNAKSNRLSRRDLLKLGGSGLGVMALSQLLPWTSKAASGAPIDGLKRLVIINLEGGNDGLNMLVPVSLSRYYERRPTIAIAQDQTLPLTQGPGSVNYALHPQLGNLQALWNESRVAFINKVGYPDADFSHFVSEDVWSYGLRQATGNAQSGWIARFADLYTASALDVVGVGMGRRKDFLGGSLNPFIVDRLDSFDVDVDWDYQRNHYLRVETVRALLGMSKATGREGEVRAAHAQALGLVDQVKAAVDSYSTTVSYSGDYVSQRMQDIAILIQGGFETKLFYTGYGGFDTHSGQLSDHDQQMARLDQALGAFVQDLKNMNVWKDTAIVIISEFGRNTFENGSAGTDHGAANCVTVLGGKVKGGIYGADVTNGDMDQEYLSYAIDFRTVYSQLLQRHLAVDPAAVFTEALEKNTSPGVFI
ncbi:MAG: DUF1501 domain-containing protein [Planctomycetota bacterium]